jgi:hypothetical protein
MVGFYENSRINRLTWENSNFNKVLLYNPDVIVISGDITHFGKNLRIIDYLKYLKEKENITILTVPGNCDTVESINKLNELNINIDEKCLNTNISHGIANQIISKREDGIFSNINEFWNYMKSLSPGVSIERIQQDFPVGFVNTHSRYFLLEAKITINNNKFITKTILNKKDGKITVMSRTYYQAL